MIYITYLTQTATTKKDFINISSLELAGDSGYPWEVGWEENPFLPVGGGSQGTLPSLHLLLTWSFCHITMLLDGCSLQRGMNISSAPHSWFHTISLLPSYKNPASLEGHTIGFYLPLDEREWGHLLTSVIHWSICSMGPLESRENTNLETRRPGAHLHPATRPQGPWLSHLVSLRWVTLSENNLPTSQAYCRNKTIERKLLWKIINSIKKYCSFEWLPLCFRHLWNMFYGASVLDMHISFKPV